MQHITYLEWLPIVLGKTAMTQHSILPVTVGYSDRDGLDTASRSFPRITGVTT